MTTTVMRCCLLLIGVVCFASCYRSPVRGGPYTLPQIGGYPAPTPTFPGRNQGLPPVYHGKFKRSIDEFAPDDDLVNIEEPSEYHVFKRSIIGEPEVEGTVLLTQDEPQDFETSRTRRAADGYRIIHPTYRPPRRSKPRTVYV